MSLPYRRFAAIDIGSNAIRLLVTQVIEHEDPFFKKLTLVRVPIRLGADVFDSGEISEDKVQRLTDALMGYQYLLKAYDVESIRACATSAMREARNGEEVIKRIFDKTGIQIEIIPGHKEAQIIFEGGGSEQLDKSATYLYIDVGGGSTELTIFSEGKVVNSESFKIGTVRFLKDKIPEKQWENLKKWLKKNLHGKHIDFAIGSGGNINKLIKLLPEKPKKDKTISYDELKSIYADLSILSEEERMEQYGLNPDRADVIVPAAKIFLTLMHWGEINEVLVPKVGLADGLIRSQYYSS